MKISIGMLAYNEAQRIDTTIRCVFSQTLLRELSAGDELELVIVPNGCKDETASIARSAIARELTGLPAGHRVSARVEEVASAGKSNAWNVYVHTHARRDADFVMLLDSDITFNHDRALRMVLDKLLATPRAHAAVGRPLKDVAFKQHKSLVERISLAVSKTNEEGPATIAGSLYVVRGEVIRQVWMPPGLLTEDGFMRAMLITDLFKAQDNTDRIVREPAASQIYEAVTSPAGVIKHTRRLLVGARINACLYDKLWALPKDKHAGEYIRENIERDPHWLRSVVSERIAGKGWWVMQPGLLTKRLQNLRYKSWPKRLLHLPVALILFPFDAGVLISANNAVRRGEFRW
jgi:glycosyltransferase involved in cell wall biosynthesis